jgi:hypothetical protein
VSTTTLFVELLISSKVRILRASVVNLPLITLFGVGLLFRIAHGQFWWLVGVVGLVLVILAV